MKHPFILAAIFTGLLCMLLMFAQHRGNIATIQYNFDGCYGSVESYLRIYRQNGQFFAQLKTTGAPPRKAPLTPAQLDSFHVFTATIKHAPAGGYSTATNTFTIRTADERIKKNVTTRFGFDKLIKCLFRKGMHTGY